MKKLPPIPLLGLVIISFLGACMEIDISIPSFPGIMEHYGASEAQVQSTLSFNFLAFCLSSLIYGPLSEAWGRRGLMLFGATVFMIGALGCVFWSSTIYQLIFWRFLQGLGAGSTFVLGFAMIADHYQNEAAANAISKLNACITVFMAMAPILGSTITRYYPWQANFSAVAFIAIITWVLLMIGLFETKPEKEPLKLKQVAKDYAEIVSNKRFMLYALMPNFLVTAYLTFVGSAAFYYMNTCQLPVLQFALHQGTLVLTFSLVSFSAEKIIAKLGGKQTVWLGVIACCIGSILLATCAYLAPYKPLLITASMSIIAIGCAFPMSVTFAKSMEIIPHLKGTSSSTIMATRLLLSSLGVMLTGVFFDGSMRPVSIIVGLAVALAVICHLLIEVYEHASQEVAQSAN